MSFTVTGPKRLDVNINQESPSTHILRAARFLCATSMR